MGTGGRNWFSNACLEFHWDFLPCLKDWMIWSTAKIGIRGRLFLAITILLQDSTDILTGTSALARSPKHNYSPSLTPGCSSWYFWMGFLMAPGHMSSDLPQGKQVSWPERWKETKLQCSVFAVSKVKTCCQNHNTFKRKLESCFCSFREKKKYSLTHHWSSHWRLKNLHAFPCHSAILLIKPHSPLLAVPAGPRHQLWLQHEFLLQQLCFSGKHLQQSHW